MASFFRILDLLNYHQWHNGLRRIVVNSYHPRSYSNYQRPGVSPDLTPRGKTLNFQSGSEIIKTHFGLLKKEIVDRWKGPDDVRSLEEYMVQQTRVVWEFRNEQDLNKWVLTSDTEIGGKSEIYLKLSKCKQSAILYGTLNTSVPRDGETKYSGYCAMRAKPKQAAFNRKKYYDWSTFNCLYLRVRGDGRPWMINLYTEPFYNHQKNDLYSYFIFTRGGPYWEEIQVPFSKLFLSSQGRVQDKQHEFMADRISTLGFTIADKVDGPFQLEIDFIGLISDRAHTETCAYEMYEIMPKK